MKVLHVVPSLEPAEGGPSVAVPLLARAVAQRGHSVAILATVRDQASDIKHRTSDVGHQGADGVEYVFLPRNTEFYKVSWELVRWLRANIRNFDLLHIHALFSFASTAAAFIAATKGAPYIVRPLGVLNSWGLENRRAILKRGSLALIERRILSRAAAVHYTTEAERLEAAKIGSWVANLPSFVCPLPVEYVDGAGEHERFFARFPQAQAKRVVLFLSRIDPKKGIELLLSAFALVRNEIQNLLLVIAGSGDRRYEASLHDKAEKLEINADVLWTGFLAGDDKAAALAAAEIFVLPSYSENFGIAAAEAFAARKACILSDQVGLAEDARLANAAVVVSCDTNALAKTIRVLLANPEQQRTLGHAALRFASERLSMVAIGEELDEAYRHLMRLPKSAG